MERTTLPCNAKKKIAKARAYFLLYFQDLFSEYTSCDDSHACSNQSSATFDADNVEVGNPDTLNFNRPQQVFEEREIAGKAYSLAPNSVLTYIQMEPVIVENIEGIGSAKLTKSMYIYQPATFE